jgi:GTP-binding protein
MKPIVALVGRPNVGKSTLFNRLVGERLAVVDRVPGTTRDRLMAEADWTGFSFLVVDTGADFIEQIRFQAEIAIREADAVLFLTDVTGGVTPADREVAQILRQHQKEVDGKLQPPVLLVVNKCEHESLRLQAYQFYELGLGEPLPISAQHGIGTGDMLDALVAAIGSSHSDDEGDDAVKIAIVGKPNSGKSSLLNRVLGEERAIVSPIAGTTRDAIDTRMVFDDIPVTLIDTAGIRRRGHIEPGVEKFSVLRSLQAIDRADVSLLVVDATSGLTAQDAHIAGYILEAWKSAVVVVNKWDAIPKDTYTMDNFTQEVRRVLNFMDYVPILFISAKTGQRIERVLPTALHVQEQRLVRLSTSQINQMIQSAQAEHPAPAHAGRQLKIFYGTQVRNDPPTFMMYVNDPRLAHFTYLRFLENKIRLSYPFLGTPIRIVLKPRH